MKKITCGFIGLGLIGGSIAKAMKQKMPDEIRIMACDINKETLRLAHAQGIADVITDTVGAAFSECDYIFLCAPVEFNDENLLKVKQYLRPDCVLTDVGSVKTPIHEAIKAAGLSGQFIGGHPMAGSERFGFINSKAALLENAYYILTPASEVSQDAVSRYSSLVEKIGAIPLVLNCEKHDYITAAVSHLPHVIASSLVNLVKDSDGEDGLMKMIAAGGFKDITRIASSSPVMWQQICMTNKDNILSLLEDYITALNKIKEEIRIQSSDSLYSFFDNARAYRDSFHDASSGPIKKSYSITLDIPDEAGSIAAVSTLLALAGISIKNIGIVHNREVQEGALAIELYDEESIEKAITVLTNRGYNTHTKK